VSTLKVDTITKADGTGSLSVPAESGTVVTTASPSLGRRNLIINGDFQVSQRGDYTSATSLTNGAYTLDRWTCTNGVGATIQHRSDMPTGEYGKSVKVLTSSGGTLQCALEQRIEVADWMKGKSVTATVWMRSNSSNSSINFYNNIGGFDTPVSHSGNEQWEKLTIQTTFPTGSLTDLRLRIGLSQGGNTSITSGDYFEIAQVQLEVGSVATPFEHRSYGEELALCQRYYQTINNFITFSAPSSNPYAIWTATVFPTQMRTSPSVSLPANIGFEEPYGSSVTATGVTIQQPTNASCCLQFSVGSVAYGAVLRSYPNSGAVNFDAEL